MTTTPDILLDYDKIMVIGLGSSFYGDAVVDEESMSKWVPVLRPGKWNGIQFTAAMLKEIASTFNPASQAVPVKLDHVEEGPALTNIAECQYHDDYQLPGTGQRSPILLVRWPKTQDVVNAASNGKYPMRSVEVWPPKHPSNPTPGKWNLKGLALLGGAAPAVPGLGPLQLSVDDSVTPGEDEFLTLREWSQEKRDKLKSGEIKGEFAGPHESFPIAGPEDVSAAASSLGRAKGDREAIKSAIIRIAKKHGWESGLPEAWKETSHNNTNTEPPMTLTPEQAVELQAKADKAQDLETQVTALQADNKKLAEEKAALAQEKITLRVKTHFDKAEAEQKITPAERALLEPLALSLSDDQTIKLSVNGTTTELSQRDTFLKVLDTFKAHGLRDPLDVPTFKSKKDGDADDMDDDEGAVAMKVAEYQSKNPGCAMQDALSYAVDEVDKAKRAKAAKAQK